MLTQVVKVYRGKVHILLYGMFFMVAALFIDKPLNISWKKCVFWCEKE
jgi:LPS O-antigen subunit length determinant protein (WzzB/FepE family)